MRRVMCGICIKNRKILLVRSRKNADTWQFPGGKPERDETDRTCLLREMSEELPHFSVSHCVYFMTVFARTPYAGDKRAFMLFVMEGNGSITPGQEIIDSMWASAAETRRLILAEATQRAVGNFISRRWL